jgi:nitroreductase
MTNPVLEAIRTRRMARILTGEPVQRAQVEAVLEAARWAPNAGNRRLHRFGMRPGSKGPYIDVGTAGQTMLLAAHSLGLGSGVVTSFSQGAVAEVLNLPGRLSPEMLVCLGHAAPQQPAVMRPRSRVTWQSLTDWERFPADC